ncbi:MAG: hypothetical protein HWN67_11340 [Candidatus Helarchaeota archaeon]|nr:hypothetical protein [Candidatus Helarchaeota archaeon]
MDYYELIMERIRLGNISGAYNLFQQCKNEGLLNSEESDRLEEIFENYLEDQRKESEEMKNEIKRNPELKRRIFRWAKEEGLLTKNQIDEFFPE